MSFLKNKHLYLALASFLLTALISVVSLSKAYAANLDIYCDDNEDGDQCDIANPPPSLFNESGWYPGSTLTKTIYVFNGDHNDDCQLTMYATSVTQTPINFVTQLNTAIKKDGTVIYGDLDGTGAATNKQTLQDIFGDNVDFYTVPKNKGSANYEWTLTFNKDAGSTFANASTNFSFNVDFKCDHDKDTYKADSHNDNNLGGAVAGAAAGGFGGFFVPFGELLGISVTTPEELIISETPPAEETPKVLGVEVQKCITNLWWILILFVQLVLTTILNKKIKKHKKLSAFLHILLTVIVSYLIWKYFCVRWPIIISLLIGFEGVYFSTKKQARFS